MAGSAQLFMSRTKDIPNPTYYVQAMNGEFVDWAFDEERAPAFKGKWRSEVFASAKTSPMDLEIGIGNGYYFAHHCQAHPERSLVGIEMKYKPLIQSVRRARKAGCENMRGVRYNARLLQDLFVGGELDNVSIYFPDPWEKKRQHKYRLIQDDYLKLLFFLQKPGSTVEFKTDSRSYFNWALERFYRSTYTVERESFDLHHSEYAVENFVTHFEQLFLSQGRAIYYARLRRL